jgi:hypothetical protein
LDFDVVDQYENIVALEGHVSDEFPEAVYITFGGILAGESTPVMPDGSFNHTGFIGEYGGTITAYATDAQGLISEEFIIFV